MGAIWFLDNPALAPEAHSCMEQLAALLWTTEEVLASAKKAPQTMLAKITSGIDPVQLAMDAVELAQGGALSGGVLSNVQTAAAYISDSLLEQEDEGVEVDDMEVDGMDFDDVEVDGMELDDVEVGDGGDANDGDTYENTMGDGSAHPPLISQCVSLH